MLMLTAYFFIASGFESATGKFWKSLAWPAYIGEIIAHEAKKRGIL
ncbi:hypothetical protein I7G59_06595 [Sinorhizobium meliloti]|nr:hypothetical protein [Sinorhizobium meliloti]MDE3797003.1 hypothetical protein [Sinorhizobium meliloti]